MTETQTTQRQAQWKISFWRPRNKGGGCASFLDYTYGGTNLWLSFIPQEGEGNKFNSKAVVKAKLSLTEVGELLAVANGYKDGVGKVKDKGGYMGLFHYPNPDNKDNSTIISLERNVETGELSMGISVKVGTASTRHSVMLGHGDSQVLRVFLENTINMITRSMGSGRPQSEESEQ